MRTELCITLAAFGLTIGAPGQTFVNLDFEQAIVEPIFDDGAFGYLSWDIAVPGWSHSEGESASVVLYRNVPLSIVQAYLLVDAVSPEWGPGAIEGEYSLYLRSGHLTGSGGPWVNAFIAQTGTVPAEARSVRLLADGPFSVFVNDEEVPMVSLGGLSYGGDIAGYGGTVSELKILNNAESPIVVQDYLIVDAIQFSPEPIPEPAAGLLFIGGAVFLSTALKIRRKR